MDIYTVQDILYYYNTHRQVGHTRTIVEGLKNNPQAKMIVGSSIQAHRNLPITAFSTTLRGQNIPIVFDHTAVEELCKFVFSNSGGDLIKEQQEKINKLSEENESLKKLIYLNGLN